MIPYQICAEIWLKGYVDLGHLRSRYEIRDIDYGIEIYMRERREAIEAFGNIGR